MEELQQEHRPAAPARAGQQDRSAFERFVEAASLWVSHAAFFFLCAALVLVWFVSAPLWADLGTWQVAIHTMSTIITLLLIALLENSARRNEEAGQEKLNVLAEALASLMDSRAADDPELREATQRLRDAVGLEERH
jgi:low affinity Fe/Cu permease